MESAAVSPGTFLARLVGGLVLFFIGAFILDKITERIGDKHYLRQKRRRAVQALAPVFVPG